MAAGSYSVYIITVATQSACSNVASYTDIATDHVRFAFMVLRWAITNPQQTTSSVKLWYRGKTLTVLNKV